MQILINLAVLAVALAVVATLACIAAGRDAVSYTHLPMR